MVSKRKTTTRRKTKIIKRKITEAQASKRLGIDPYHVAISAYDLNQRIKAHKLKFEVDYERGIYDISPKEADMYIDSIDDILTIIRKMY